MTQPRSVESFDTPRAPAAAYIERVASLGAAHRAPMPGGELSIRAWGERDVIALRYMHERQALFRRLQPRCPFHVVQGAGHWVMYERPERFNPLMLSLLERFACQRNDAPDGRV